MIIVTLEKFWNRTYINKPLSIPVDEPILSVALKHFDDVQGTRLLDLEYESGNSFLFFANQGATVVSVDISDVAINQLSNFWIKEASQNITPLDDT